MGAAAAAMLAGAGRVGFVLLLRLLLLTASEVRSSPGGAGTAEQQQQPRSIGVCWKPFSFATLQQEVRNMSTQLSATELLVYCGLGAQTNGSFGVVTASHPNRWGQPDLCLPAIAAATQGGVVSIQVMVESRTDMPAFAAALGRGGQAFGREMFGLLGSQFPGVTGVTFDFERGEDKSAPFPTPEQFAAFLGGVVSASPQLSDGSARYAVDVSMDSKGCPYLSDFPPLLRAGVRRVRDMGEFDNHALCLRTGLHRVSFTKTADTPDCCNQACTTPPTAVSGTQRSRLPSPTQRRASMAARRPRWSG